MSLFSRIASLAFLLATLVPLPAGAWQPFGPPGGSVRSLAVDPAAPETVYAGTWRSGVLKSTNGGKSWAFSGLAGETVDALAVDPSRPRTLLAGTYADGLHRSTDAGATWRRVLSSDDQAPIQALLFDPAVPGRAWAATETGGNDGVHRTTDGGVTWARSTSGLPHNFRLTALALLPGTPPALVAGTTSEGLFRSTDAGATWSALGGSGELGFVHALTVTATEPPSLYVGTNRGPFVSPDRGETFLPARGREWRERTVFALAPDPVDPHVLYAGVPNKLLAARGGGTSWRSLTEGFSFVNFDAVVAAGRDPVRIYAGTSRDGVLSSTDGGATWSGPGWGFFALDVSAIVTDPRSPGTAWIASPQAGVFRTTDGGKTWALQEDGLDDPRVKSLLLRPGASPALLSGTEDGVFVSEDSGRTFRPARDGLGSGTEIEAIAADPAAAGRLVCRDEDTVFESSDGARWKALTPDLDRGSTTRGFFPLAVDPSGSGTVLAATHAGLFRRTTGSTAWEPAGAGIPYARVQALAFAADGKTAWAGTDREGVFRSTDGGKSWTESRSGLGRVNVQAIALDPEAAGTLWAATWDKGLFRSKDDGKSWARAGGDPPHPDLVAVCVEPGPRKSILVGTSGGGAWRLDPEAVAAEPPARSPTKAPAGKGKRAGKP
ncbi:MAG: hypothetical protein EDX89_02350 [Acidobacteria bacterium]|nr:MAG: hypothetical protein EDX89_02350 [Acidobacteriota bacterium]MCE7957314.1 hypothetical protein [Acidobacteria bacterium ACB2]